MGALKITALTTACHRPEAWALSEKWMKRQTRQPDQWIVLDDDDPATVCTMGQKYVYRPEWRGRGSLTKKIRAAMAENMIEGDAIVFWENDDFYAPHYIETVEKWLQTFELVGEGRSIYYNVVHRFSFDHGNLAHASLCSTAVRRECFPQLQRACNTDDPFVDWRLWQTSRSRKKVFDPKVHGHQRMVLGMKGFPGRVGYGTGHTTKDKVPNGDRDLSHLISLIGDDAYEYEHFAPQFPKVIRPMNNIAKSECGRGHGRNWLTWMGHLRGTPAMGLEIGTFKGESAEWFLDNLLDHLDSRLHCVDSFAGGEDHHAHGVDCTSLWDQAATRLKPYEGKVAYHRGLSNDMLREMAWKGEFDFVYVDAGHTSIDTLRDAVLAYDLLKVGGVMVFDDYTWDAMPRATDRPKMAVDAFLACFADELTVIGRGYQVAVKKKERGVVQMKPGMPVTIPVNGDGQDPLSELGMWIDWQKRVQKALPNFAANTIYVEQESVPWQEFLRWSQYLAKDGKMVDEAGKLRDQKYGARVVKTPYGPVTRMWMDSNIEIDFLRRNMPTLPSTRVLDIGAGYGRLAVPLAQVVAAVTCVDAVPISTKLCTEYCAEYAPGVQVLSLGEFRAKMPSLSFDLAINVHSWNECTYEQIERWLEVLKQMGVPSIFTVSHGRLTGPETPYRSWDPPQRSWRPLLEEDFDLVAEESIGLGSHPHALWKRR